MIKDRPMLLRVALCKKMSKLIALATAAALAIAPMAARAEDENKGPSLLRDAETEQLLRDYTRPVLRAAGLEKQNIQVVIINDKAFNAFVADGRRIFVNYGALMQSETPNQIVGTPSASRVMATGVLRPASAAVPSSCGRLARI